MEGFRRFVGVGIDEYDSTDFERLDYPVAEVQAVAELLHPSFVGEPLVDDVTDEQVRKALEQLPGTGPDVLVLLWSGHGFAKGDQFWLQTKNRRMLINEVVGFCADSGASQLLLVIDTCHSGQGIADASRVASALLAEYPPNNDRVWFGVLVSCRAGETARDGAFGAELRRLLSEGPRSPILRDRWRHSRMLFGDDLAAALLEDWADHAQQPEYLNRGRRWFMLPNPLWDPGAPAQVVEHVLLAARGGGEQSWFSGRSAEVDQVVGWVDERTPGIWVVTGSAGTGKSAIVGRVVSLSNPSERQRLREQGGWQHADPGENSVHAHVHARGLTADLAAELMDAQLIRQDGAEADSAVLVPAQAGRRNAAELVGALQRARERGGNPPVVVVDGLDEARGEVFAIAEGLLVRMAAFATVIVSTRPLTREKAPQSLLDALAPVGVLDLDGPAAQESQHAAIGDYVSRRLAGRDSAMDPALVARELLDGAGVHGESFLLARIVADQLVVSPVNTALLNWHDLLARSIGEAFDVDVARISIDDFHTFEVANPPGLARAMLTALTWALGAGFPEDEWLAVAAALAGAPVNSSHTSWVLDQLGRYVIQDGEAGLVVYRLAHQSLADHLRRPYQPTAEQPFDPAAAVVCAALAGRYSQLLQDAHPATAPAYLWRYTWRHAADAGLDGISMLRSLADQDSALAPHIAYADGAVAATFAGWGRERDALPPTEEAVTLFRELAAANPAYLPDLASALHDLGTRYYEQGRPLDALPLAEEAATLGRELATADPDDPAHLPALANALNDLGIHYSRLGRPRDALPPAEEAVTIFRELAAANPAHLADLARALSNLGERYGEMGRPREGVPPTEEAVTVFRELFAANSAHLPALADALNSLGLSYGALGRELDALPPAEEAVTLYRELAAANPYYLRSLAGGLNNLGLRYGRLRRSQDALPPTAEAVTIFRELAAANPAHLPHLANALTNFGTHYIELDRFQDALPPTEEAVALFRELVATNAAHLLHLARALDQLGTCDSALGRSEDALHPAEEAVALFRELSATNPAQLDNFALALDHLGLRYSALGRELDVLPPTEEAVAIFRELATTNPAYLPALASALSDLGNRYSALGRSQDALPPAEETVAIFRELVAADPAHLPNLAAALSILGLRYSALGRELDALPSTEEAVAIFRELATTNPARLPALASALSDLGNRYSALGRSQDAPPPTEEAVAIFRELVAADPAHLLDLAAALANLGNRYYALGLSRDTLPPTAEAVTLYRELATTNTAHLRDLARALINLDRLLATAPATAGYASYLADSIKTLDPQHRPLLEIHLSYFTTRGDVRAATWLADAADAAGDEPALIVEIHDSARSHRSVNPQAWDTAWAGATGEAAPAWLTVDTAVLATARDWTRTPTCEAQRDYLAVHLELLEPAADTALKEALLSFSDEDRERYRRIRSASRTDGVEATYRPLIKDELLQIFGSTTADQQQRLLDEHRNDLLDPAVKSQLAEAAETENASPPMLRAHALLTIAADPNGAQILDQIASALTDPQKWPGLLRAIATNPDMVANRDDAADMLAAAAIIGVTVAATPQAVGLALLYFAAAAAMANDMDEAVELLQQALAGVPGERMAWVNLLAELGSANPAVLTLIPHLTESGQ